MKYGVTKSLTADFTYNTDFAQVEVDEAQVNLTRFSLLVPGEAGVLPRGPGHSFGVRRAASAARSAGERCADDLLQPAHRLEGATRRAHHRRRPAHGTRGPWTIGALNIDSDRDDIVAGVEHTNFTVAAACGATCCAGAPSARCSRADRSRPCARDRNEVVGLDANFSLLPERLPERLSSPSRGPRAASGEDVSYRGKFNYAADRYGLQLDRIVVGDRISIPRWDSCAARTSGATSRRPASARVPDGMRRSASTTSRAASTTSPTTTTSWSRRQAPRRVPDGAAEQRRDSTSSIRRDYEFLRRPFRWRPPGAHPGRRLFDFSHVRVAYRSRAAASPVGHRSPRRRRATTTATGTRRRSTPGWRHATARASSRTSR